jgi:branched-chain amino acid transport system permease protein
MSWMLLFSQLLNGLQFGCLLFLLAAGLTLIFGVMNFVNLAHGSLYMVGAYVAAEVMNRSGSMLLAIAAAVPFCFLLGVIIDRLIAARLHGSDHLYQVLATFGVILFANEMVRIGWGAASYYMAMPDALSGTVGWDAFQYPSYRLAIILVGLATAASCSLLISRTRFGMLIRAGAVNAPMVEALGVNISHLNALLFGIGAALAGLAGLMVGPLASLQPGMGEPVLILTLVVIVVGGIGSVRGAFYAALLVGMLDTLGRAWIPQFCRQLFDRPTAQAVGPAAASMAIYFFMAVVLAFRPDGLFPARRR